MNKTTMPMSDFILDMRAEEKLKAGLYQFWEQLTKDGLTKMSWQEWYKTKQFERKKNIERWKRKKQEKVLKVK